MAGKHGMKRTPKADSLRQNLWRSMRIMKTFTIPGLMTTVPGVTYKNTCKFLSRLHRHGVVTKIGGYVSGRAGDQQQYHLVKNSGPVYPAMCEKCGQPLSAKICDPSLKEREKEKETKKEREEGVTDDHDRPDATAA